MKTSFRKNDSLYRFETIIKVNGRVKKAYSLYVCNVYRETRTFAVRATQKQIISGFDR